MAGSREELPKEMNCAKAERPLRIALAYSRVPFPMMRGDQLTVAHFLSYLAKRGHTVDLYTLDVQGELTPTQKNWLGEACRTVNIYAQGKVSQAVGALTGLLRGLPLQVGIFQNSQLKADLQKATRAGEYDVVYCYYIRSAPAIDVTLCKSRGERGDKSRSAPISVLAMQLSQTLNSQRIYENEQNFLKKLLYYVETKLCARYEARVWQDFTRSVLIGPADVDAVERVCVSEGQPKIDNWFYGPHGTDTDRFQPATDEEVVPNRIIFSGSMLYQPNIQAVLWFVKNCWPTIQKEVPEAEFIIQGRDPVPEIVALGETKGITVTGTVPDVGVLIRSASVCVNPMLAAGGMQNKLIEYMACGKAVVATTIANEGIQAPADKIRIADDAKEFTRATLELLKDKRKAKDLSSAAREYAIKNWTWEAHFMNWEREFYATIDQ